MKNIDFTTDDVKGCILNIIGNDLGLNDVVILETRVVTTRNKSKLAIVRLGSTGNKKDVMKSRKKLAGSQISISPDYTVKEQQHQRKLRLLADELRKGGKEVTVTYNKLFVDGVGSEYRWQDCTSGRERKHCCGPKCAQPSFSAILMTFNEASLM